MGSSSRRLRAFKRWTRSQGIDFSDALQFTDDGEAISVRALCDLKVGDMVARIPKTTCLTVKTSGARDLIESAGLGGSLGLSVAVLYERSLGQSSPWAPYLHLQPFRNGKAGRRRGVVDISRKWIAVVSAGFAQYLL
ncbi:hypothetical protein SO802_034022 [Lithocarpus litseifolius]|uniref:Uncharacterized protein n=1 Tax=Lithocarpus litseifolius TaxID=425828 RepID=A0AAW2BGY4_9ROSI